MKLLDSLRGGGAHTSGVGDRVHVGERVKVRESVKVSVSVMVRVGLRVHVRVIEFVNQGVHVRERVGGQVIVGVGESGTAQQICRSTDATYQLPVEFRQSGTLLPLNPGMPW